MTEAIIQQTAVSIFRTIYPKFRLVASQNGINLHNLPSKIKTQIINQSKKEGMLKGAPDLVVYIDGGRCIHFEFKTPVGKQSPEQIEFQEAIEELGHSYYVVRSAEEMIKIVNKYLSRVVKDQAIIELMEEELNYEDDYIRYINL
jgi:hypothetical protein